MKNTDYKSTNALMEHLRHNGIAISGDSQKQQLINTGYFHGYKGYRFFMLIRRTPATNRHFRRRPPPRTVCFSI